MYGKDQHRCIFLEIFLVVTEAMMAVIWMLAGSF